MSSEWSRIGKDFLFEKSLRDKKGQQVTLLQSWNNIVAMIIQDTKTMVKTKKHYSYNVSMSLEKLVKQQKLSVIELVDKNMYNLLCEKLGDCFFINPDGDIKYTESSEDEETLEDILEELENE